MNKIVSDRLCYEMSQYKTLSESFTEMTYCNEVNSLIKMEFLEISIVHCCKYCNEILFMLRVHISGYAVNQMT